ncbi:MAG TPA: tetratricopeptide repeat protein [bacterium]|nr:tetratricopeptide repeat protein [bacterium]
MRRVTGLVALLLVTALGAGCDLRDAQWHAELAAEMYDLAYYYPHNNQIALDHLNCLIGDHPDAPGIDAAYYFRARCLARVGADDTAVRSACGELLARFPASRYGYLLQRWQAEQPAIPAPAVCPLPDAERLFLDAIGDYERKNIATAMEKFSKLIASYPDAPDIRQAYYYRARCLHVLVQNEPAVAAYREVMTRYPGSVEAVRAQNHIAYVLAARLQRIDDAMQTLEQLRHANPDHPNHGWVLLDLAHCYQAKNDGMRANELFEQAQLLREDMRIWNGRRAYEYAGWQLPSPTPASRCYLFPEEVHVIGVFLVTH